MSIYSLAECGHSVIVGMDCSLCVFEAELIATAALRERLRLAEVVVEIARKAAPLFEWKTHDARDDLTTALNTYDHYREKESK